MKKNLIIFVMLAIILLISWGHIAIWHNWTWVYYIPGSAWIGTAIYAIIIGILGKIGTAGFGKVVTYANAVVIAIICGIAQYLAFEPSFLADGDWSDWVSLFFIILIGAFLSGAFSSGNKDMLDAISNT